MKALKVSSTFLASLLLAGTNFITASADIVSFNIYGENMRNQMDPSGDFAGAPGVRTTNWNQLSSTTLSFPAGTVQDNTSAFLPSISVDLTPGGSFLDRADGGTNDNKMINTVVDKFEGTPAMVVVSNIPYANYNVYFYHRPENGNGLNNARGGYFTMTNSAGEVHRRYISTQDKSTAVQLPSTVGTDGSGYVLANTTTIAPSGSFSQIDGGHYVKFSGLTNADFTVLMSALGNGAADDAGNVITDGSTARRLKYAGFQIEEVQIGVATNLSLAVPVPDMLQGNPATFTVQVEAEFNDGTSADVTSAPGISYLSRNTAVFTVTSGGVIQPLNAGTADLEINYQSVSLTQAVTVLAPVLLSAPTVANPDLFVGNNAGDVTTATLRATFNGFTNINVTAFTGTSFSGGPAGVVGVEVNGTVTATGAGSFFVFGNYGGLSATNNSAGTVTTFVAPTGADSFGVNITDANRTMNFKDLSGAPGSRSAYWNNLPLLGGTASNQFAAPLDFQGNILGSTVIQVTGRSQGNGPRTDGTPTVNESVLFRTHYDSGLNNPAGGYLEQTGLIVVSNVPYAKYDVNFYVHNDSGQLDRSGYFRPLETGQYHTRKNFSGPQLPNTDGTGYVMAAPQVFNGAFGDYPASLADAPEGNYVHVSGLTNPDLVVEWGATYLDFFDDPTGVDTVARLRLAGFEIVKSLVDLTATNLYVQTSVPALLPNDSSTFALTVLADFNDGTTGGNVTSLAGVSYSSENNSVFTVDSSGILQAGSTPGTANLVIDYQSVSFTQAVTTLAPTEVRVVARPDTYYTDSLIGTGTGQARLVADFPGMPGVDISGFTDVSFSSPEPGIASVDATGVITPTGAGMADITGTYLGTPYTTPDAVNVTSISAPPVLKHRWSFRDSGSIIEDSVGNADGTVFPALGGFMNVTLDGERAHFPGDSDYTTAPYISFAPGLVTERGDITIEMWVGINQVKTWSRFFVSGETTKGTDPHNDGNGSGLSFLSVYASYAGDGDSSLSYNVGGSGTDLRMTNDFGTGIERHLVAVYAPHRGEVKIYVDGVLHTSNVPASALTGMMDNVVWLGVSRWNDSTLNGWFNELRIHEGAFSDADVAASFAAGPNAGLPAGNPDLAILQSGANVVLSWTTNATSFTLMSNTTPVLPFFPVNITPTVSGSNNTVTVQATENSVFFILEQ